MELIPNWQETFEDFPAIPNSKRWVDNNYTPEQNATRKLVANEPVDEKDLSSIVDSINFYKALIPKLKTYSIQGLTETELNNFKEYFEYAFNITLLTQSQLSVTRLIRLVRNNCVPTEKGKIREEKYITYPSIDIVKKLDRFNRANTKNNNLFYATDSIDTALLELKPQIGEAVSVGIWLPKQSGVTSLKSYPVTHNPLALKVNPTAQHGFFAFQEMIKNYHPLLSEFMKIVFGYISDEFAKPVVNHLDYFFSATFAERILQYNVDKDWISDCIIYPSVGNKYSADNVAIKPSVIDSKFKLAKVFHFEIEETNYEVEPPRVDPFSINVIKHKNFEETDWIEASGDIVW